MGNFLPAAGTVVIFGHDGDAKHSCLALSNGKLGGYNQIDWFLSTGLKNDYTEHATSDMRWLGKPGENFIAMGTSPNKGNLIGVPGSTAVNWFKFNSKGLLDAIFGGRTYIDARTEIKPDAVSFQKPKVLLG